MFVCLQKNPVHRLGSGRRGLQGDLAIWSPVLSFASSGIVHTGMVRCRCISRLLLLGTVVVVIGVGPRLAVTRSCPLKSLTAPENGEEG